jgi:hypothetical protein
VVAEWLAERRQCVDGQLDTAVAKPSPA